MLRNFGGRLTRVVCTAWLLMSLVAFGQGQSGDGDDEEYREKTAWACENSELLMECPDSHVIRIVRANYGRFSVKLCNPFGDTGMNLRCVSITSKDIVANKCDGHRRCNFKVDNRLFGDPCPGTSKYAEVKFFCEYAQNEVLPVVPSQTAIPFIPPWLRRTVPVPQNVQVCHHAQSRRSVFDISWSMPKALPELGLLHFNVKIRNRDTNEVSGHDIIANDLGDGKYAYSWRADYPDGDYDFAIKASSYVVGEGEYSDFVPSAFCAGEPMQTDAPKTTSSTTTTETPEDIVMQPTPAGIRMCPEIENMGVRWPESRPEDVQSAVCPPQLGQGTMLYKCLKTGVWDPNGPETDGCFTRGRPVEKFSSPSSTTASTATSTYIPHFPPETEPLSPAEREKKIASLERKAKGILMNLTAPRRFNQTAHRSKEFFSIASDLPALTQSMSQEIQKVKDKKQKKMLADTFKDSILNIGDELLRDYNSWSNMSVGQQRSSAAALLVSMETAGLLAASTMDVGTSNISRKASLVMKLVNADILSGLNATLVDRSEMGSAKANQFTIPSSVLRQVAGTQKSVVPVVFVVYPNISEWLMPTSYVNKTGADANANIAFISDTPGQEPPRRIINSDIISASMSHMRVKNLKKPVVFLVEHGQVEAVANPKCSFWDTDTNDWSSEGCYIQSTNKTHTTCECYHLTSFAVLMDITGVTVMMPSSVRFSLELITYIGCTISIICLMLSWATFACFKSLDCDRNTIHKHLVFCLMVAQIVLVIGIQQTELRILCGIIAGVLHYLFLAAFAWMCLEGVQLYAMLIEVFEAERSRVLWFYLFGYGTPAIIVAISAGIYSQGYGTETHCWLTTERGFIWSFVGPALTVMLVNAIMLSMAIYIMVRHSGMSHTMRQKTVPQKMRTWIKGAVVLVVLLGLTWTFGVLYLDKNTLVFCYLFTILNCLQGLFIFLFHCVLNEKVQKEYRRLIRHSHWLPDVIRVRYGGASSSGSKEQSSSGNVMSRFFRGKKRLSNGDSSSNSAQPFLKKDQRRISSSVPSSSDGATSSRLSSDTSHNNNNRKSSRSSSGGGRFLRPQEVNGINGEPLSEVLDCSRVESEFVSEYMQKNLRVSAEQKRYSTASEDSGRGGGGRFGEEEEDGDRLAALSVESLSKQQQPFISDKSEDEKSDESGDESVPHPHFQNRHLSSRDGGYERVSDELNPHYADEMTDDGYERARPRFNPRNAGETMDDDYELVGPGLKQHYGGDTDGMRPRYIAEAQPLVKQTDSERVLINNAVNKPRPLDQPSPRQSPSLKHVNSGAETTSGTGSTPNLKFKPGITTTVNPPPASSPEKEVVMNSLPNLTGATPNGPEVMCVQNGNGPNGVKSSPGVKRHSSDGHVYFSPFRFSGSEC